MVATLKPDVDVRGKKRMRIGELAAKTGVSVRALRYYEDRELLVPMRSPSGQRQYAESAVGRVQLIQQLYAAGLSSRTILGILPCVVTGEVTPELLDRLTAERERIDGRIGELTETRDRLDTIIATSTASLRAGKPCATSESPRSADSRPKRFQVLR